MPRRPELIPRTRLETKIPEDIRARLDLFLYSELEQRVPQGAYQTFFLDRIREFFDWGTLDLGEGLFVRGSKESIKSLKEKLAWPA